jgi:hypothetical protein
MSTDAKLFMLLPLAIIIIALGVYPAPALNWMSTSLGHLVDFVNNNAGTGADERLLIACNELTRKRVRAHMIDNIFKHISSSGLKSRWR